MQKEQQDHRNRVASARHRAATAPHLGWDERVLLAAAEAAGRCIAPSVRSAVACVIADKASHAVRDADHVGEVRAAVRDAVAAAGLDGEVTSAQVSRLAWQLVFDLWGGPDR